MSGVQTRVVNNYTATRDWEKGELLLGNISMIVVHHFEGQLTPSSSTAPRTESVLRQGFVFYIKPSDRIGITLCAQSFGSRVSKLELSPPSSMEGYSGTDKGVCTFSRFNSH